MSQPHQSLRVAGLVAAVGLGWLSRDLWWAWNHAPYDRGGGWVALVWWLWLGYRAWRPDGYPQAMGLTLAVGFGLVGWVGHLNAAAHVGLILSGVAWVSDRREQVALALGGIAWLPALGWLGSAVASPGMTLLGRIVLLVLGAVTGMMLAQRRRAA